MRLSFRTKLLASYLGLVAIVEIIAIAVLDQSLGADLTRQLDQRLEQQAQGAAVWVSARHLAHRGPETDYHRQASRLAGVVGAWVTIVDADGNVVGDSAGGESTQTSVLENGAVPTEIAAARRGGVGHATRYWAPRGGQVHFVAVPADYGLIVRLGVPLSEIDATLRHMQGRLSSASLLALIAALGLGLLAANVIVRPLHAMTAIASRIARGDYDVGLEPGAPDEFGILSRTLVSMAAELRARIGDLTSERDRLSAILSGMVEGVLVVGPDRRVVIANPSARRILGDDGSLVGKTVGEGIRDPTMRVLLDRSLDGDAGGELRELTIGNAPDGGQTLVVTVRALGSGAFSGLVAVLYDVTQLRRLESVRRDFVANVSHELRTPVAAIQGYAETLLRGTADSRTTAEFLEVIHRHARRIGRLVADLLRLVELDARPSEAASRAAFPVDVVVARAVETMQDRAAEATVRITTDVAPGVVALGDPDGFEQVLENLLDNAIKYGRPGGRVMITGSCDGDRVRLVVADDGPGIAPEHLGRVFERFYRVDAGRSRELGGSGLGLSIVRRLVQTMGGSIAAESQVGHGTRFLIELPAVDR